MSETDFRRLAFVGAYNTYMATLVGDPAPYVRSLHARMTAPEAGDLVMEFTTIYHEDRDAHRFGVLSRKVLEPVFTPEVWVEQGGGDDPIPTERVWYIALPDGTEYRWHNADFLALPTRIVHPADVFGAFTASPQHETERTR